ncbi:MULTISPECIES: flagellar motor control protein ZomB [Mycobacteroides]|uniref:flagellar motor control protein ZomB n=1 Tax=unclassified Mycobacteroides TaxID=2618759 RepID=UPI0013F4C7C1|nr:MULTISPECIES: flagellar motor control protein ZomB [Mycobacteroides]
MTRFTVWVSVLTVTVLFGWGAWQRRWIADDGLIVLRTVRNLLAGNGPVFNKGERVEANTSTVWTYLTYLGGWAGGGIRLEYVALALSLVLSLVGVALAILGTARLYAPLLAGRAAVMVPAGMLVYIAIPPARDFATSGLENGLVLAYLGGLWLMMVIWAQAVRAPVTLDRRGGPHQPVDPRIVHAGRKDQKDVLSRRFTIGLAFMAGLSVLIRPELALVGGGFLVMMLIAARGFTSRVYIVAAGGALPVLYQIFRMGYYGLLVPSTAIAKDASGSKWGQGFVYLQNMNSPYLIWVPAVLLIALGVAAYQARRGQWWVRQVAAPGYGWLARLVQNPTAVVIFMLASGFIQGLYWIRQGGDFMHARVLLTPVFCMLLPIAVVPLAAPDSAAFTPKQARLLTGATIGLFAGIAGWALWVANSPGMGGDGTKVTYSGIVDERRFYAQATGIAHPLTAADYLNYPRMRAVLVAIDNTPDGALLLPSGNYDQWDVVPAIPPPPPIPHDYRGPHAVLFTNLGMLGMNLGLDVRIVDQIGLANPLAAHTTRITDGRIGHDKDLFPEWMIADGPWLKRYPYIPRYLSQDWVAEAVEALKCPRTEAMLGSIRRPLSPRLFVSNLLHAAEFTTYRFDRVPRLELARCGLPMPKLDTPPYTGLPATGP